jgi:hypothetical protein
MIISHEHKFIFLKTNKTAGTSIEAALCGCCGETDVITPFRVDNEEARLGRGPQNYRIVHKLKPKRPLWRKLLRRPERYWHSSVGYYEHMPAWQVRDYVGKDAWRSYFKFAFDRNPWDRQVSWYFYKTKSKRRKPRFDDFMRAKNQAYVNNYDLYTIDGALAVDFIGRYEHLENDLVKILEIIGIEGALSLPKTNVSATRDSDYRTYYSVETHSLVAHWYAREISLLDYTF